MELLKRVGLWPITNIRDDGEVVEVFGALEYVKNDGFYWKGKRVSKSEWIQLVMLYWKFHEYEWWIEKLVDLWGLFGSSKVVPFASVNPGVFIKSGNVLMDAGFHTPVGWIFEPVDGVRFDLKNKRFENGKPDRFVIVSAGQYGFTVWVVQPVGNGFWIAVQAESSSSDGSCGYTHYLNYGPVVVDYVCTDEPVRDAYSRDLRGVYYFKRVSENEFVIEGARGLYVGENYVAVGEKIKDVPAGWTVMRNMNFTVTYFRSIGNYVVTYNPDSGHLEVTNVVGKVVFDGKGEDLVEVFGSLKNVKQLFFTISLI